MAGPFTRLANGLYRYLIAFLGILVILWAGWHIKGQIAEIRDKESLHRYLQDGASNLERDVAERKAQTKNSVEQMKKASDAELAKRIDQLGNQINEKTIRVASLDGITDAINPSRQLEIAKLKSEISLATQERDYLVSVRSYRFSLNECGRKNGECERIRQQHIVAFKQYNVLVVQIAQYDGDWQAIYNPLSDKYKIRKALEKQRDALAIQTQDLLLQHQTCSVSARKICSGRQPGEFSIDTGPIDQALSNLQNHVGGLGKELAGNWLKNVFLDPLRDVFPLALQVFAGVVFGGVGIKCFLYFVLAPRAASGTPICLMPHASPLHSPDIEHEKSSVSVSIDLGATDELLVHHAYFHSAAEGANKGARWLLSYQMPLLSWAAGLVNVTTVTSERQSVVTLSAGKHSLEELLILKLGQGESVSLRASHLVGLVRSKGEDVRITRHWRVFSLQAWLTLQLRYVVFQGPTTLVIKGCRGVRVESSDNRRAIEQSATVGFSAHLNYGTVRTETFRTYLTGASELLLDRFHGANGIFIYEEMPQASSPGGVTGRRIGGALDAALKVVGL